MKVRFHFRRIGKGNAVPVYHQPLMAANIRAWILDCFQDPYDISFDLYTFSSLKGLNKCESNFLFFHTNQIHVMISTPNEQWLKRLVEYVMQLEKFQVHDMVLSPEAYEYAEVLQLKEETRYVSLSPMVLFDPTVKPGAPVDLLNPYSEQFSDLLYDTLLDRMESYRWGNFKYENYSRFQVVPDSAYIEKLKVNKKKLGRVLDVGEKKVKAYLFPFTLYAHPDVQNFVYDAGIGTLGNEGFGCLDLVLEKKVSYVRH
ncbi:MAG: hypothetical protein EBS07_07490 [Sphingobacteriia bacterium]|nr:hypothetical protein [Sphingobacteriia bacterium]